MGRDEISVEEAREFARAVLRAFPWRDGLRPDGAPR
jgi:hypothetical protein